jgi:hypothetical protein
VPLEMDVDHHVPILFGHFPNLFGTQVAGVVNQDVEPAEVFDRAIDDSLATRHRGHAVGVGHRLAARGFDLVDHAVRDALIRALAGWRTAEIVDYNFGALLSQQQRFATPDSTSSAGDHRDLSGEPLCHR